MQIKHFYYANYLHVDIWIKTCHLQHHYVLLILDFRAIIIKLIQYLILPDHLEHLLHVRV